MYRKSALTLVGILVIMAVLVGIGLSIHYFRTSHKNKSPITQVDSVVSPPTPRFIDATPTPQPTSISITEIAPTNPAPKIVGSTGSLPKTGPESALFLIFMLSGIAGALTYYANKRSKLASSWKKITIN